MKFLHAGDVHLGAEPESGTGLGPLRRSEIWEAFRDIITICELEKVDLLLLPGDLFHGQPLLREVKEVDYLFRLLSHTRVVMCAGNHDCLLPSSHYYDVTFPEHVTFLMDSHADSVFFPELNTEVFGLSYETKQIPEPRYNAMQVSDHTRINILLAHGNILCNDKSVPLHRGILEQAGFDYVALGHLHNRINISERIAYSGSLEPLNRGETGAKGYIIGEIIKEGETSGIQWEFVPHARREYIPLTCEVTVQSTELSISSELLSEIQKRGTGHMYLVTLAGTRAEEAVWSTEAVQAVLRNRGVNIIELKDETVPDIDVDFFRREQPETLVGRFILRMDGIEDRELGKRAMEYGLQALIGRDERQ